MEHFSDEEIINILKQQMRISKYVIFSTGSKNTGTFDTSEEKKVIKDCMNLSIDLCLEIDSFDYLVKSIQPPLESKDYGELFLTTLQPFILCDKIKNITLSSDIVLNLIDLYNKEDKLDILCQMLLHININSIDTSEIRQKLEELNSLYILLEDVIVRRLLKTRGKFQPHE